MDKTNYSAEEIAEIMVNSNLGEICNPTSGNCVEVAIAMNEVFDIDSYYVALEPGQKSTRPAHIAVVKDDVIIDATGVVSEGRMKAYATAGLTRKEAKRADWGPASLGLFEDHYQIGEGEKELVDKIVQKIVNQEP